MTVNIHHKLMRVAAVIVAAGRGERAGQSAEGPKQYRKIGGEAVLVHTLRAFINCPFIDHIVVVIHNEDRKLFSQAVKDYAAHVIAVTGGATRQESTRRGLLALKEKGMDYVLIHDGVRPFVSAELLQRLVFNLTPKAGILPALSISDTLKVVGHDAMVHATVPRAGLYAAQTPQAFPYKVIMAAHDAAVSAIELTFTDDCAIAEWHGLPVRVVEGSAENMKITWAKDIETAHGRLSQNLHRTVVDTSRIAPQRTLAAISVCDKALT